MSAFQVSTDHIEAMLAAAGRYGSGRFAGEGTFSYYHRGERHCLGMSGAMAAAGWMLWKANAASVEARYPENRPGLEGAREAGMIPELVDDFAFRPGRQRTPSPVETLKLCDCFVYQSCEDEGWSDSEAAAFVVALKEYAIRALPGYDDAAWEWSR